MNRIGRRSIASVINVFVSVIAFGAWFGAAFGAVMLLVIPFVSLPITVTAPVSYTLDTPDEILGGRVGWGFEFRETGRPPARRTDQLTRVEGSMRVPVTNRWFIAVNGLALVGVALFVAISLGKLRSVLRTLIVDGQPFVAENAA